MDTHQTEFIKRLREARKFASKSFAELTEALGHDIYLPDTVKAMAEFLGVEAVWLYYGHGPMVKAAPAAALEASSKDILSCILTTLAAHAGMVRSLD